MSAETTIKLSQISNIIGIKDAGGDLQVTAQIVEESAPGFLVWSGDDVQTIPLMSVGGYGIVSVASHLVGKQIQEMIGHFLAGRVGEAAALHRKLRPFFNAMFVTTNPIPLKYALRKVGFDVGSVRLPLVEPEPAQAARGGRGARQRADRPADPRQRLTIRPVQIRTPALILGSGGLFVFSCGPR